MGDPDHPLQCKYKKGALEGCDDGYIEKEECSVARPWYEGGFTHE